MKPYPHACTNCGVPYHPRRRLRQGRCSACYQWWQKHGEERPRDRAAARKRIAPNGRMRYGKSCPDCGDWIAMRSVRCASCAARARERAKRC